MTTKTVGQAIEQSVTETGIVHMAWTAEAAEALTIECDDHVRNGSVEEFWGTTEDGGEWRVHLDGARDVGRILDEVTLAVGHDGTADLGVIVRQALKDDPSATAAEIAEIVREARADAQAE